MKNALDWIKSNPISAVSIVVAFLGVVVFLFVLFVQAPALRQRVVDDNSKQANDLNALTSARVSLPNSDPNEPPIQLPPLVVNEEMITFVRGVYDQVERQSAGIKGSTIGINARHHQDYTFVDGALFGPDAEPTPAMIVAASEDYRNSFDAMFQEGHASLNMPFLFVGMPPRPTEVEEALVLTLENYLQSVGATATSELTQQQAEELFQLQQVAVMDMLAERAQNIQLYADALPLPILEEEDDGAPAGGRGLGGLGGLGASVGATGMDRYSSDYPFEIAEWAFAAEQAKLDQLWEGQVQVWITRDIMLAINNVNSQPSPDGGDPVPMSVLDAPVKRLISLQIVPGYVGLHSGGGINPVAGSGGGGNSGGAALGNRGGGAMGPGGRGGLAPGGPAGRGGLTAPGAPPPGGPGGLEGSAGPGAMPGATGGTEAPTVEVSGVYGTPALASLPTPKQPIVDSFFFGPTGRYSNSVFDVRHARLVLHIDWARLPAFFDELRRVNFMTVIDMKVTDLDEYDLLASGFVYGTGDVVEVELVIETLWYRDWTADLMPKIVRDALLVQDMPETN